MIPLWSKRERERERGIIGRRIPVETFTVFMCPLLGPEINRALHTNGSLQPKLPITMVMRSTVQT